MSDSTGAIPELPKGQKISETTEYDPDKVVGWYSRTKAMATQAVLDAAKNRGLNACVVHPSGILGPNDFAVSETTGTLIKIINGEMPIGHARAPLTCVMSGIWHLDALRQPIKGARESAISWAMRKSR